MKQDRSGTMADLPDLPAELQLTERQLAVVSQAFELIATIEECLRRGYVFRTTQGGRKLRTITEIALCLADHAEVCLEDEDGNVVDQIRSSHGKNSRKRRAE